VKQEMLVKHYAPLKIFCHIFFVQLDKSVKNKLPKLERVLLLARTDVWTKFEEDRSRRSWVIDWERFWHIWPWWPWPL